MLMRPAPSDKIKKVLISGYTGLGAFVLKSVLIKKIRELYPGCMIFIIAGNSFGTEFVLHGYPTLILRQSSNALKKIIFFLKLRKEKIDVAFLPFDASPKFLIRGSILAGIPIRIGHVFDQESFPRYYYTISIPVEDKKIRSEIDLNIDLLQALYKRNFQRNYQTSVDAKYDTEILEANGLKKDSYICLQMGGANGLPTTKRWLEPYYRELIKKLLEMYSDLNIVALGDEGDAAIVKSVCRGIHSNNLKNLAGKISIEEAKNLISSCKLLICHDSGLLHIGNALQKNIIAIYGPSDPDIYALELPTCHIIRKKCDCSPCQGLFPGKFSYITEEEALSKCPVPKCMKIIKVNDVYNKCVELLNNPSSLKSNELNINNAS